MAIYDMSGRSLSSCYGVSGGVLQKAYDMSGREIWALNPVSLKVANYNVGDWYIGSHTYVPTSYKTEYLDLQNAIFTAIDVDVCCMQEAPPKFCQDGTMASVFLDNYFDYFETAAAYTSSTIPYRTIGSNIEIEDFESINFGTGAYYDTTRTYEKFYITVGGKRICFISSHLALVHSYTVNQAMEMLAAVNGEEYYVIMGDYNTVIYEDVEDFRTTQDYQDIIVPYLTAGCNSANLSDFGVFFTYYSNTLEEIEQHPSSANYMCATDQIFTSPNITINNAYINTIKLYDGINQKIDHVPIIAELTVY